MTFARPNIAALAGYVPGEQPTDPAVIKLNTNENPYPPSPWVMQAVASITPEQLRRYPSPLANPFREAAGKVLGIGADHILATNGGDELLDLVFRAFVGERDRVGYFTPSYSLYPVLADIAAAHKAEVPYRPDWTMDVETMLQTFPKLVLVTNPNAPSGTMVSPATLFGLAVGLAENGGVLVVDEAYTDFAPGSCLSLVARLPNLIILRSLSKGYSLAGMRFGFAIAQPGLIQELVKVKASYNVDAVSIAAATAAILDQDYARETWRKVGWERERLTSELRRRGFELPDSVSNFVFARVPTKAGVKNPADDLYQTLKACGILVRYWNAPGLHQHVRISIGTKEQMDRLLEEIDRWKNAETSQGHNAER